jgi:hypothetical protein
MAKGIDFQAPGCRESLWTTGEKTGFLRVHCEVPEQPNLDFSKIQHPWEKGDG